MGLVRDFTRDTRERLLENVEENDGFFDKVGDFFGDCWLNIKSWFGGVSLADDMSNVEKYHREIIDKNNTSKDDIRYIFENVYTVESNYANLFKQNIHSLDAYRELVKQLTEAIDDKDFVKNFDMDAWRMKMEDSYNRLTWLQWEEILSLPADQITDEQYEKIAYLLLTTNDDYIVEAILNKCYMPDVSYSNNIRPGTVTAWTQDPKMQRIYDEMQLITYNLIDDMQYASEEEIAALWENGSLSRAIQRTQLFQSFVLNTDVIATNGLYGTSPEIKLSWENDSYVLKYKTLDSSHSEVGTWISMVKNSADTDSAEHARMEALNPDWKIVTSSKDDPWYKTVSAKDTVVTVNNWQIGFRADEFNKLETKNYISSYFGLSQSNVSSSAVSKSVDKVKGKTISFFIGLLPGSNYVSSAKDLYDIGSGVYKKSQDVDTFEAITNISNIGAVADLFNMAYIATDINGDSKRHSYSLFPTPPYPSIPEMQTTSKCLENFNNNLLHNPEYAQLADNIEFDTPLTMDDLMNNPQKVIDLIERIGKFSHGENTRNLVVHPYP